MSTKKKIITFIIGVEAVIIAIVIIFLFYINSDTVKVNRQLELAQRYLLEEDYEQAIATFQIVIEIDPRNVDAYIGLAEAYVSADELGNAVKTLEKAAEWTDSEEILAMLEQHTTAIAQRELAAQKAAEAAQAAALAASGSAAPVPAEETGDVLQQETIMTSELILTGFIMRNGELYYYDEIGMFVTGWFDKNSNRYCARDDGRLYRSGEYEIDSLNYLFDSEGICLGEMPSEELSLQEEESDIYDDLLPFLFEFAFGYGFEQDYDCQTTTSGLLRAMLGEPSCYVPAWYPYNTGTYEWNASDPLGRWDAYSSVSEQQINWCLKNIFNCPDEDIITMKVNLSLEESDRIYLYDGYYYYEIGGIGSTWEGYIESVIKNGDKYNVTWSLRDYFDGGIYGYYNAVVGVKIIDGKKYWSLYSNKKI